MEWFRGHYLNGQADIGDPRASPLKANDLAGLPPALVYTAGFDPLRDEGQAYADRLAAAGVKTIHHEFESLIHGFVGLRGTVQAAARAMDDMGWAAASVRSRIFSRRKARPTRGRTAAGAAPGAVNRWARPSGSTTRKPSPSGPRWRMGACIRISAATPSGAAARSRSTLIPHM